MIRILHIIDSLQAGGMERQLIELLRGLKSSGGFDSEVVCLSNRIHYDAVYELANNVHVIERRTRWDPLISFRLASINNRFRPHIVHAWSSMGSIYAAFLALTGRVKLVNGTIRDAPADVGIHNKVYRRLRVTSPISSVIVANSGAGLRAYHAVGPKGIIIHNGFDVSRIDRLPCEQLVRRELNLEKSKIVGMVGRFHRSKDYATYLSAARRVADRNPEVMFVALGEGPDFDHFRNLVLNWGVANIRVIHARKDVEAIINTFSVGVLCTDSRFHGEGISNAIMEYMALGKPVIATEGGGNSELIVHGKTGFLIPALDVTQLTDRICELLEHSELREKMGSAGSQRIRQLFTMDKMLSAYQTLYRRIANSKT